MTPKQAIEGIAAAIATCMYVLLPALWIITLEVLLPVGYLVRMRMDLHMEVERSGVEASIDKYF